MTLTWQHVLRGIGAALTALVSAYLGLCTLGLVSYTVVDPYVTGVQLQRRIESWDEETSYERHYTPVPLDRISDHLERAVVAAEDSRFYQHHGIDWQAIRKAIKERRQGESNRGGSSITQQLVKNLFMTTHSTYLRKALEVPLAYAAELILSKRRILELYLNVIEWGPGVYGAEAASLHYYGVPADGLSRYQSAALAACIPDPLHRIPQRMGWYTSIILQRMRILAGGAPAPSRAAEPSPSNADTVAARSSVPDSQSAGRDSLLANPDTVAPKALPPLPPDSVRTDSSRTDTTTSS